MNLYSGGIVKSFISKFGVVFVICALMVVLFDVRLDQAEASTPATTIWAKSTVATPDFADFEGAATDSSGNIYAVGMINGTGWYDFGNSITVQGKYSENNVVIVKYNPAGDAQWAKSADVAPNVSYFSGVAVDPSGDIYAVGTIYGHGTDLYNFGNSITVKGAFDNWGNVVIVKYNSAGDAQWAKSTVEAPGESHFSGVAIASSGDIYAVGNIQSSTDPYNFGPSVTVTAGGSGLSALIVKYNSSGDAQWARSTVSGASWSPFNGVAVASSGDIYAVGSIFGTGPYKFSDSVTVSGDYSGNNVSIVKYNSSGDAQWAKSTVEGSDESLFYGVAVDLSGNIYAVGLIAGNGPYKFSDSVPVNGDNSDGNIVIVKYNSAGDAQWAKSTIKGPDYSDFYGTAVDPSGNVYAVGYIGGTGQYDFGNSVTVSGGDSDSNSFIVKYNSSGDAQWAKSTVATPTESDSGFNGVTVDSSGNVYAVGVIDGQGEFDFGDNVTVDAQFDSNYNTVMVKYYDPQSTPEPTPTSILPQSGAEIGL
jgi:hypothetical protein